MPDFGAFHGRWDGNPWIGRGYAVLQTDTLYLVGHRPDPQFYYDEYVRIRVAFRGVGTYVLNIADASLEQITGGDAGYFPGAVGELHITHYDSGEARVGGTVHLAAAQHGFSWRFEQGSFDVPVYARWLDVPQDPVR